MERRSRPPPTPLFFDCQSRKKCGGRKGKFTRRRETCFLSVFPWKCPTKHYLRKGFLPLTASRAGYLVEMHCLSFIALTSQSDDDSGAAIAKDVQVP